VAADSPCTPAAMAKLLPLPPTMICDEFIAGLALIYCGIWLSNTLDLMRTPCICRHCCAWQEHAQSDLLPGDVMHT